MKGTSTPEHFPREPQCQQENREVYTTDSRSCPWNFSDSLSWQWLVCDFVMSNGRIWGRIDVSLYR